MKRHAPIACGLALLPALLAPGVALTPSPAGPVEVTWSAPETYVEGRPFRVRVEVRAEKATEVDAGAITRGLTVGGKPAIAAKAEGVLSGSLDVPAGGEVSWSFDLAPHLDVSGDFDLALPAAGGDPVRVGAYRELADPRGVDFMKAPADALAGAMVLLQTNRGELLLELWPHVAPEHVRNFLDLSASGFYEKTKFHRVSPGFMIQGGCPNTRKGDSSLWGTGAGPRQLDPEFSDQKHVRGVLSMARGPAVDSASCQFFVMTAEAPGLDNQYSAFGRLRRGYDVLDRIASAKGVISPRDGTVRPAEPQEIERAVVLLPLARKPADLEPK